MFFGKTLCSHGASFHWILVKCCEKPCNGPTSHPGDGGGGGGGGSHFLFLHATKTMINCPQYGTLSIGLTQTLLYLTWQ